MFYLPLVGMTFVGSPSLEDMEGVYVYSPQPGEQVKIKKCVEDTLAEFNPLFRVIARPKLEKGAKIDKSIELNVNDDEITVTHVNDKRIILNLPLDTDVRNDVENLTHHLSWNDNKLERLDSSLFGGREVTYELNDDGNILNIKVKMFGSQLPKPIIYTLKYLRQLVN